MPNEASSLGDQSTESEGLFEISPHCTWCALHAIRLQERSKRSHQEPYGSGDSSSSTGGKRKVMRFRRKAQKAEFCDSDRDSSSDESLSKKERADHCRRCGPDVLNKCSRVRNTCACSLSEDKAKMTGPNARCPHSPSPDAELLKICEDDKSGCDDDAEGADGAKKNFRQIVMESRCPCLYAYLHFTDTVDACTCVRRSPSCSAPDRDSKAVNVPDDRARSSSAPNDKQRFCCSIARYFSPFRRQSKRRDVDTHQPSPLSLEQKNSAPADDRQVAKDTCCLKDGDQWGTCEIRYKNSEMMKSNVSRKLSKRESYQSAGVQRDTNTASAPREITAVLGRDSCLKCREADCGLEDAVKVVSNVRCTCDCEARNKDLKKFRSSLRRICRALSGCKRDACPCECHGKQREGKNVNDTQIRSEEAFNRRRKVNGGSGEKTSLPKRGLLALKYEILRCKELDCNRKETESDYSACEWNQRGCHCLKHPPETEQRCSSKDAGRPDRKLDNCCVSEEKKCKACLYEQNKPQKNDSHERQGTTVPMANTKAENHRYAKEKVKQKRSSNKKNSLANAQKLHDRDPRGRSADDSSDESELEVRKNRTGKENEIKNNSKYPREEHNDNDSIMDPIRAEIVKIGDHYYQAVRHQTAHVNIMSFKNLKEHRETHRRAKRKKSPGIEVRLRYDTTSSEEDSSEPLVPSAGPLGDSTCRLSKLEKRKSGKRRTAREKAVKKVVGSATKEAKKRQRLPPSAEATDGHCGNSPTPPVTRQRIDQKDAERKDSSEEAMSRDVERLPKAMTDPPPSSGKAVSPPVWKSEDSQLKRRGVTARTLELKQMSDRWFAGDPKQWCSDKLETAGGADKSGSCDVRPFTASSSAS